MYTAHISGIKITIYSDNCDQNATEIFTFIKGSHPNMLRRLTDDIHTWINQSVFFRLSDKYTVALRKLLEHYAAAISNIGDEIYVNDTDTKRCYLHVIPVLEEKFAQVIYI